MKTVGFVALLCLAAVADGFAADMPMPAPPVPPTAMRRSKTTIGAGFTSGSMEGMASDTRTGVTLLCHSRQEPSAVTEPWLGATLGINYQAGPFVFGFEADADWTGFKGTSAVAYCSRDNDGCGMRNTRTLARYISGTYWLCRRPVLDIWHRGWCHRQYLGRSNTSGDIRHLKQFRLDSGWGHRNKHRTELDRKN